MIYNLVLTLSVYSVMTAACAVLLILIIQRQEMRIDEVLHSRLRARPLGIVHKDGEAAQSMELYYPLNFDAPEVYYADQG
ncbi:MAG: hypothetical protein PQJ58_00925 [Spirochaetales bacterium]|nr:hypothetical protein [Spirochaetales bacterium]